MSLPADSALCQGFFWSVLHPWTGSCGQSRENEQRSKSSWLPAQASHFLFTCRSLIKKNFDKNNTQPREFCFRLQMNSTVVLGGSYVANSSRVANRGRTGTTLRPIVSTLTPLLRLMSSEFRPSDRRWAKVRLVSSFMKKLNQCRCFLRSLLSLNAALRSNWILSDSEAAPCSDSAL